jgi:hypothetical protein
VLVFGGSSTQRNGIDNKTKGRLAMADEDNPSITIPDIVWYGVAALAIIFMCYIAFSPKGGTSTPTPNLYELTRQSAENTSHIFWLIVVCFTAWSIRSYKTGS